MISVIIPVYNRIEALKKSLDSVARQTYKDIEVIAVDDGSSEKFQISDLDFPNNALIRLLRQKNMGAPAARNNGLREANGEYVIFWDADVIGMPGMLEKLKQQLDEHPEASFAYCNFTLRRCVLGLNKKMPAKEFDTEELKKNNYIHSTALIKRKEAMRWDENLRRFQDWDFWLSMTEQGRMGIWVDEYLFVVESGGTISQWLPSFAYRAPFKWLPCIIDRVRKYEEAKMVVLKKHGLFTLAS